MNPIHTLYRAGFAVLCTALLAACGGTEPESPEETTEAAVYGVAPDLAGRLAESAKDELLAPAQTGTTPEGYELGNLSEHGAIELLTEADWQRFREASRTEPVLLFKHSTQCNISGGAYRRTGAYLDTLGDAAPRVALVKVIERRPVSQTIEKDLGVKHESPQAILLKDGEAVWDTSHEAIDAESLSQALKSVKIGGTE
jgi:bacillithiol system protein YtxJ